MTLMYLKNIGLNVSYASAMLGGSVVLQSGWTHSTICFHKLDTLQSSRLCEVGLYAAYRGHQTMLKAFRSNKESASVSSVDHPS